LEKNCRAEVTKVAWEEHRRRDCSSLRRTLNGVSGAEETEWEKVVLRAEAMWMNQEVSAELNSEVWA